jgi:hypothetical protein
MVEKSMLWDTGVVGSDGENPFDQEEWSLLFMEMFTRDPNEGPLHTYGAGYDVEGELEVIAATGQVLVLSGRALVGGFPYRNTGTVTFPVDLPSTTWRADKVLVRTDWATKKVRLAYEKNPSEGIDDLVTHHVRGDHWDIPLATVIVETDGTITCEDIRQFCSGSVSVKGDTVKVGSLTKTNMADRPYWELWPVFPCTLDGTLSFGAPPSWYAPDGKDTTFFAKGRIPATYVAGTMKFSIVGHGTTSANYWLTVEVWQSREGYPYDEEKGEAGGVISLTANLATAGIAEVTMNPFALEGYVTVKVTRWGTAPGDNGANFVIDGVRVLYNQDH